MADTGVEDLNTNFMSLGRCDLDIFNGERLTGFPGDGSLWIVLVYSFLA